jgi:non-ribosomal peptide synthetase component F/NRPS condensation-like uncharacterized protein
MEKKNIESIYPLSPAQEGMLYETVRSAGTGIHIEQLVLTLSGELDTTAFQRAWQWAANRHEVLRTCFVWETQAEPLQVVLRQVDITIERHDWQKLAIQEQEQQLELYLEEDRRRGFKVAHAPLMRLALIQVERETYHFVWTHHHILMDGWCTHLVMKEVLNCYQAFREGRWFSLERNRPYKDYITWLKKQNLVQAEHFWRQTLHGFSQPALPGREEAQEESICTQETGYASQSKDLSQSATTQLQALAGQHRLTLNTLLQGIWAVLLSRYGDCHDVVFGITVSGRPAELVGVEKMVGLCINTLPVRIQFSPETSFWSLLKDVQAYNVELRQYEYSPAGLVHQWSDVPGTAPLYESLLVVENYPADPSLFQSEALKFTVKHIRSQGARTKYALTILVTMGARLGITCVYDRNRFRDSAISHILEHFQGLLMYLIEDQKSPTVAVLQAQIPGHTLPRMKRLSESRRAAMAAPRTPAEEVLAGIWTELLKREQISINENFFILGGHSLLATQLISRIRTKFQLNLPLRDLFEAPTIAQLARRILARKYSQLDPEAQPIVPLAHRNQIPLSFAQQRLWFLEQLVADNVSYNISRPFRLRGWLDSAALERSLQEIVSRHEILRTTFMLVDSQPVQTITPSQTLKMPVIDLEALLEARREPEALERIITEARRPFDLVQGPLFRVLLFRFNESEHVLLLTIHHIVFDAWSEGVFLRELIALYNSFALHVPSPLVPLPIQYADFAVWQRDWLQGEVLAEQIAYWQKQLHGAKELELPTDYPRPALYSSHGALVKFQFSRSVAEQLLALSRREGVTLFMMLLAAFQTLLYRYSGEKDVLVGTDIANRVYTETEALIGFFVNILVLRTNFSENPRFCDLLQQVREMVLGAYAHQDLPFEKLVNALQLERTFNQIPLVRVLFVLQNTPMPALAMQGLAIEPMELEIRTTNFDLALFISEGRDGGLQGAVNYNTDIFAASTIMQLLSRFEVLLQDVVAHPDARVDALEIYTAYEKLQRDMKDRERQEQQRRKLRKGRKEGLHLAE